MHPKTVDAATLKNWLASGEAVLVDVREPAEHRAERIENAMLLPLGRARAAKLPRGRRIVVHCARGGRGGTACRTLLAENPALEIYNLEGGIGAWRAAGYPVQTSGRPVLPLDRQVQLTIGLCLLAASALAWFVTPLFLVLTVLFGAGLTLAGATGFCGLGRLMARMPWNQGTA